MKLGPTQIALLRLFLERDLLTRHDIAEGLSLKSAFDSSKQVSYLRQRINRVGATIHARHGRGYWMERADRIIVNDKILNRRVA